MIVRIHNSRQALKKKDRLPNVSKIDNGLNTTLQNIEISIMNNIVAIVGNRHF
jgi:hypothetical protein